MYEYGCLKYPLLDSGLSSPACVTVSVTVVFCCIPPPLPVTVMG